MDLNAIIATMLHLPLDWVILGVVAILLAFETYRSGSSHASALAVSFPIAYVLLQWVPTTLPLSSIPLMSDPRVLAGIFSAVVIFLVMLVGRIFFTFSTGSGGILQAALCGIGTSVIVVVFWVASPTLSAVYVFGPQIQAVFGEAFRAWWILAAFFALAFARD